VNATDLLWTDTGVYRRRLEKSAAALIAVQRSIRSESHRVPGADEFLKLYEWLARADAECFTRIWSDPVAYYWVRRTVHFLAAIHGAPLGTLEQAYCAEVGVSGPIEALRIHLGKFKRFVLGAAMISGADVAFTEPYTATIPLSLPGTGLNLGGSGRVTMRGVRRGKIDAIDEELQVLTCPTVEVGGFCLTLNPILFNLPGLGFGGEWTTMPLEFQARHSELVAEALSAIARLQPETFSHFGQAIRAVALKPAREGNFGSISSSELPGAFVCSVPCDSYELAATFIHEFHHNRLYYLEETGPFFEPATEDEFEGENHYSPWRETLRPLHGLLHALYVYLPVFHFWAAAVREGGLIGPRLAYAKDQLGRIPFQLRVGVNQLRRHAKFTAFGSMLFEQMARETTDTELEAGGLGVSLDTPAMSLRAGGIFRPTMREGDSRQMTIGETLRAHLERSDIRGECGEEKAFLVRSGRMP
jgi:HEXXH motif-containing protein